MALSSTDGILITFVDKSEHSLPDYKSDSLSLSHQGYSYDELLEIQQLLSSYNVKSTLINLGQYGNSETSAIRTGILIIHQGLHIFVNQPNQFHHELNNLIWDHQGKMYGSIRHKVSRHTLCFADINSSSNHEHGQGTVENFNKLPILSHIRQYLPKICGTKSMNLMADGSRFYNVNTCGLHYHGNINANIVIGFQVGSKIPISFQWFYQNKPVGQAFETILNSGDMFISDNFAFGLHSRKRNIPVLKHAFGGQQYTKIKI